MPGSVRLINGRMMMMCVSPVPQTSSLFLCKHLSCSHDAREYAWSETQRVRDAKAKENERKKARLTINDVRCSLRRIFRKNNKKKRRR